MEEARGQPVVGDRILLRVPTIDDVDLLDAWGASVEARGEFNDFGLPVQSTRETAEKDAFIDEHHGKLIIQRLDDGARLGTVDWRPSLYGPPPESRAWALGISLAPEARGSGYGPEALRLAAEYLFAATSANRVEGETDVDNIPGQRALEKAGFVREGIIHGAQWRRGAYHDLVLYGLVRPAT